MYSQLLLYARPISGNLMYKSESGNNTNPGGHKGDQAAMGQAQ